MPSNRKARRAPSVSASFDKAQRRSRVKYIPDGDEPVTLFTGVWPGRLEFQIFEPGLPKIRIPSKDINEQIAYQFFHVELPDVWEFSHSWGILSMSDVQLELRFGEYMLAPDLSGFFDDLSHEKLITFEFRFELRLVSRKWRRPQHEPEGRANIKHLNSIMAVSASGPSALKVAAAYRLL